MILHLIEDINKALDNDCCFSALALALTLPDICGKAEYPDKGTGARYKDWYDENVGRYERCPEEAGKTPYLSGEVVYSLRNMFLHQGTPNIEPQKIKDECCKIEHFALRLTPKNRFGSYADHASWVEENCDTADARITNITYEVDVRRLCFILSRCAEAYYKDNRERFDFFKFNIKEE